MKWVITIIAIAGLIYLFSGPTKNKNPYESESSQANKEDCQSPSDPYDEGSGHYAGFEWGVEGNDCGGNSDSFIEGCEEYVRQLNSYNACME